MGIKNLDYKNYNFFGGRNNILQDILGYFLFALNLILMAVAAFAGLAYLLQHLNQEKKQDQDKGFRRNLPLYEILLDFQHRDVDHWYAWLKTQALFKQEEALQRMIDYLSGPIEYKGLVTRDILKIIVKFPYDNLYFFLEDFSKSALRNWHKNKAIASFYLQSLLSLIELDSAKAGALILSQLKQNKNDPNMFVANKYMIMSLLNLKNTNELSHCFKEILFDEGFSMDFKIESLESLKEETTKFFDVIPKVISELLVCKHKNYHLFDYCFEEILLSRKLDQKEIKELVLECFSDLNMENESVKVLLNVLASKEALIPQKLLFSILNTIRPENKKLLKHILVERADLSNPELNLIKQKEMLDLDFDSLSNDGYDFKVFNFDQAINSDPDLSEELIAMKNILSAEVKPCLKVIYGKSKLEKLYLAKVVASLANRSLLVLDLDNVLDFSTPINKLEQVLAEDPSKFVFIKNLKALAVNMADPEKRKKAFQVFTLLKKFINLSNGHFLASVEDKLEDLLDNDQNYKAMCDEFGQLILHSYTFDIESLGRKKEIFKKIKESIREDRINDLNSFDEFEEEIIDLSHFEFLNYIYKFVSDSLITHKRLLSVKIYNHLLGDTKIFDNKKKPVFKFECAT